MAKPSIPGENLDRNGRAKVVLVASFPSGASSWKLLVCLSLLMMYCVELLSNSLAVMVLLVFFMSGCFAVEFVIVRWMLHHHLLIRAECLIACVGLSFSVDALPLCFFGECFATDVVLVSGALSLWCSSSLANMKGSCDA
jgi:hypothetical protein